MLVSEGACSGGDDKDNNMIYFLEIYLDDNALVKGYVKRIRARRQPTLHKPKQGAFPFCAKKRSNLYRGIWGSYLQQLSRVV